MPTVYGYARVSREDQNLALQLDALAAAGVQPAHVVQEKMSGAAQRPAFERLIAKLQAGDSLVAWKPDRLGRNTLDVVRLIDTLRDRGVRLVITTLGLDSETPAGRMVLGIMASLAEYERAQLIERTKAGQDAARRRGVAMGRKPKLTPHQCREAARMVTVEGKSMGEVAALFECGTSIIFRAVKAARERAALDATITQARSS